jgi:hypothetical protein
MNISPHAKAKLGQALNHWSDKLNYLARYLVHCSWAKIAVANPPASGCLLAHEDGPSTRPTIKTSNFIYVTFWSTLAPHLGGGREKYRTDTGAACGRRRMWTARYPRQSGRDDRREPFQGGRAANAMRSTSSATASQCQRTDSSTQTPSKPIFRASVAEPLATANALALEGAN